MVKLQAASVSNQVVRKRKRKASASAAEEQNGSSGNDAAGGARAKTPRPPASLKRQASSKTAAAAAAAANIPWPEAFASLARLFRALNTVYTFCCTRKHIATTFGNLRAAVEGQVRRAVGVDEVARVAALVPGMVSFAYVDPAALQVDALGENGGGAGEVFRKYSGLESGAGGREAEEGGADGGREEVLLFEFLDGDLKRQVKHSKTGEAVKPYRKLRDEDLKMPVYSHKQMVGLIEKRNAKFTAAVNEFLARCREEGIDPELKLLDVYGEYVPKPSEEAPPSNVAALKTALPAVIPKERKFIREIIEEIKSEEWYTEQIVPDGHRVFDEQEPVYGELSFQLSQGLVNALFNFKGIRSLYAHQAEAINNLYDGHDVIISTSTSSGKSLIYQIPVLHELERDPETRAIYIFPTKALAQDQRRSLKSLLGYMEGMEHLMVETFDGDTPMQERHQIRDEARIIFTNPDMLHITILPQEERWRAFLKHLKFVVVDELHVYNGLFGSHVALIMRRLRRVCASVGNRNVRFISCSATVANPEQHMKTIFGVDEVRLTDFDGSPSGRKEFLCWNTPFKDPDDPTSGRGSAFEEAARLFCHLILRGVRVIAFARIRKMCEILQQAVRTELIRMDRAEVVPRVMSYRGGYTPQDRRQIESEMFDGKLVGIVATNALELGIDIGSLDAVVTVGFPYTIANLRQQSGRAGRRNKDSLSVLVGDCFPTDQFFMQNPDEIFTRPNCELQVDLTNMLVLEGHIQCAANEMPVHPVEDQAFFGELLPSIASERMRRDEDGFYHCNSRYLPHPSRFVTIRDTEDTHFAIIDTSHGRNVVLEELEGSRAFFTIYEGGIFLHQGNTYLVKEFSQERMMAKVEYVKVDWTTQQRDFTDIDPVETEAIRRLAGSRSRAFYGPIRIKQVVFGFFKVDKRRRILDAVEVDNPPIVLYSRGMWLDVPKRALEILARRRLNAAAAIHAAEHAVLSLMPSFVISMPGDVRTECKNAQKEYQKRESARKRPARLTFYDAKGGAGGSGISTKVFEFVDELLARACERVAQCHCLEGCPECCCSETCKEQNLVLSKAGAGVVLKALLNRDIAEDELPWGEEDSMPAGVETVVLAEEVPRARAGAVVVKEEPVDD